MSSEALAWAFKQDVKPSGAKFTLVALCECANYQTGRIMPSIAHLVEITGQDRKTIINHIAQLERQGFITDTGERVGTTKQIKVYSAEIGTVPEAEQSQKRNSPKSPPKQSQKRDTEPSGEPSTKNTCKRVIPDDWAPRAFGPGSKCSEIIASWAPGELETQIRHFTVHHRSKGNRFVDWQDAWETWVLNSRKWGASNGRQSKPANPGSAAQGSFLERYKAQQRPAIASG